MFENGRVNLSPVVIGRLAIPLGALVWLACATNAAAQGQTSPLGDCRKSVAFSAQGDISRDDKAGHASGAVHVECDGTSIFAEEISWDEHTVRARGDLLVTQEGLRVNADHMEMDRQTRLGTFYNAHGTARLTDTPQPRDMLGSMEPELWFDAEKLERLGPRTYRLTNGVFSTCVQPNPRWEMRGTSGTVILDDHAVLKNVLFRVKGIPVLYFPYLYYPLKKEDRSTGFLLPVYSTSGVRGQGISNGFFWAISRSMDATLNHDYFSKAGQVGAVEYRYVAAPGSQGNARFKVLDEKERLNDDGTIARNAHRSYDFTGSLNQRLGPHFQVIGNSTYFTDITAQQLYQQDVQQLSNRNRNLNLTLSGNVKRLRVSALVQRTEIFTGEQSSQQSSTPRVSVGLDGRTIGHSKVYFSASGEAAYLQARPQDLAQPERSSRWFDGSATLRAPLSKLPYLRFTTSATWRMTYWLDSQDPVSLLPVAVPITRSLFDLRADLVGPTLSRVFQTPKNGYAERFKHEIEPRVTVQWQSPFDHQAQLISMDPRVDGAVGGTRVNYSLDNVVKARTRTPDGSRVRQFLSVTVGQSYYTRPQTAAVDPQYSLASAGTFSPVQVTATVTPTDEVSGRFQASINSPDWATRGSPAPRASYSATSFVTLTRLQLSAGWSRTDWLSAAEGFVDLPSTHALNASTTVKTPDGRAGGTYGFNLDVKTGRFLQQRVVLYYHAQCCGIAVDYQRFNLSSAVSSVLQDHRFAITFTLAGIGSFSPPLGAFGR